MADTVTVTEKDTVVVTGENTFTVVTVGVQGPAGISGSSVPATTSTIGGIIVGDNLSITGNGVLSAQPGGVTAFNNRTGNVSLTSSDVTSALTYTPLTTSTPYSNLSFTGTSAANPFTFKVQNANGSRYIVFNSGSSVNQVNADFQWVINNTRANGVIDTYYPFFRLYTSPGFEEVPANEGNVGLYYNYTRSDAPTIYLNSSLRVYKNRVEYYASQFGNAWTDNSLITRFYADTRYLTSANLTFANLTGTPTTLAGYGITDGLTSANLTPYLTIANANSTYSVLGHTHAIANVTGLQTALDAKLPSANFTYANLTGTPTLANVATSGNYTDLTGTPNLTLYLTTANAAATYSVLTHNHVIANVTGLQTALDSKLPSSNFTYANLTGPQNLLDTELIRAKLRDYSETVSSPTISAGTLVLNLETSNIFTVSLNAAITTLTISNPPASGSGGSFTLIFTADGTARAVTWPASIKWAGGTAPTLTSTSGKVDSFAFFTSDGGTTWQGYIGGQNF